MRRSALFVGLYALVAPVVFLLAFRSADAFRVELGAADESYRTGGAAAWGRPYEDKGPFRIRRGERYMTYFAARMAFEGAGVRIPDVVRGGGAELRLRMHRYAEPGIVAVYVNGVSVGEVDYREDSYPWDVRRFEIPESFLGRGELAVELERIVTEAHGRLPPLAIAAFDWVELAPRGSSYLSPTGSQWLFALLLPFLVYLAARALTSLAGVAELASLSSLGAVAWAHAAGTGSAAAACSRIWIAFPLAALLWIVLAALRTASRRRFASGFALVLLSASTVIFWPDHLPPDVRPHLRQVRRVEAVDWRSEAFREVASSFTKDGRTLSLGRYHPDATTVAPYPLGSYFVVHFLRKLLDEPRFLVEYLSVLWASVLWLLTCLLARALASDRLALAPAFTAALFAFDLSVWHHASRAHMPALFGQMFLVGAILYLVVKQEELDRPRALAGLALLSFAATLAYSATLLHFVVLVAWLVLLEIASARSLFLRREALGYWGTSVAGTLGAVAAFYRHFLPGLSGLPGQGGVELALLRSEGYRPQATFYLLRNQVRDTVRVLEGGYPLWWLLALPAYVKLGEWTRNAFSRRVVWAWTAAFLTFLVLKDPLFFPRLFLQVKEHLFFASLLSVLGGVSLARLAGKGAMGKAAAGALLASALVLRVADYLANADMIHGP